MTVDREQLLALGASGRRFAYTKRDTIIYALGCGLGSDPADPRHLKFVYEPDLVALPTLACVLTAGFDTLVGSGLDYAKLVHAEQRLELHAPLPPEGDIIAEWGIIEVVDKGPDKGALITAQLKIANMDGSPLATVLRTSLARGDGGIGGPSVSRYPAIAMPDRAADREMCIPTLPQQALIYRLNGDPNPLHADPLAARRAGFSQPILHGLCTYAIAGRAILEAWCDLDPAPLRALDARFVAPVFPGEDLLVRMWREPNNPTVLFEVKVPTRDITALRAGRALIG